MLVTFQFMPGRSLSISKTTPVGKVKSKHILKPETKDKQIFGVKFEHCSEGLGILKCSAWHHLLTIPKVNWSSWHCGQKTCHELPYCRDVFYYPCCIWPIPCNLIPLCHLKKVTELFLISLQRNHSQTNPFSHKHIYD